VPNRTLYVKDAEPGAPIIVDIENSSDVVNEVGGIVYTAPGENVIFNATEENYTDNPVYYYWDLNYHWWNPDNEEYSWCEEHDIVYTEENGSIQHSWNECGTYKIGVKKIDADGSEVIKGMIIVVTPDTDGDGELDIFDLDDDNDGIEDAHEVYTRVIGTEEVYRIRDGEKLTIRLSNVKALGEIVSATAKIGIRHEQIKDLKISLDSSSRAEIVLYEKTLYPDYPVFNESFHETIDLLNFDDRLSEYYDSYYPWSFEYETTWDLNIEDTVEDDGDEGFLEYFEIRLQYTSNTLDNDTDDDGLTDGEELNFSADGYITDPCDQDTDDDGLNDTEELNMRTNPTRQDTDGDGAEDGEDIDPLHDVMLRLDIYKFQRRQNSYDNMFFEGEIDDHEVAGKRVFRTDPYYDAGTTEHFFKVNNRKSGVYYYNIADSAIDSNNVDFTIRAKCYRGDEGKPSKQLDCDGTGGDVVDFTYSPVSGELSYEGNEVKSYTVSGDKSFTDIKLEGDSSNRGVYVWINISKTYVDKINTFLVAPEYAVVENVDGRPRYNGEDEFFLFLVTTDSLEVGPTDPTAYYYNLYEDGSARYWRDREHAVIVPKSTFFTSRFYSLTCEGYGEANYKGMGNLDYIDETVDESNDGAFITRGFDYDDNRLYLGPRDVEAVIMLNLTSTSLSGGKTAIGEFLNDLSKNSGGDTIAKVHYLKPYSYEFNDDSHEDLDLLHSVGLSKGLIRLILNAEKITESPIFNYAEPDGGFVNFDLDWKDIVDFLLTVGAMRYKFCLFLGKVLCQIGLGIIRGILAVPGIIYNGLVYTCNLIWTSMLNEGHYRYGRVETNNSGENPGFGMNIFKGSDYIGTTKLDALVVIPSQVFNPILEIMRCPIMLPSVAEKIIERAEDEYAKEKYEDFIRYPSFGSPKIMKADEILTIYITDTNIENDTWTVAIRQCETGDSWNLTNLTAENPQENDINYGKITGDIPEGANNDSKMYDIIITKNNETIKDVEPHCLQLIEEYDTDPKFAHISDIHVGEYGAERELMLLINALNSDPDIDFVLLSGDIVHGGQTWGDIQSWKLHKWWDTAYATPEGTGFTVEKEWKVVWFLLRYLKMPVYVTPGNHDYFKYPLFTALIIEGYHDLSLDFFHEYLLPEFESKTLSGSPEADPNDYSFDYGDYHFISVNSGKPVGDRVSSVEGDGLTKEQTAWIEADYDDAVQAGKNHTFIFTHNPVVSNYTFAWKDFTHESPNDYYFVQWVEEDSPNIEVVFCGHTHQLNFYNEAKTIVGGEDDQHLNWNKITDSCGKSFSYYFDYSMLITELG